MPVITPSKIASIGTATVTQTTLNGTDSFVYNEGVSKYLILRNPTGGALSPVIDGADAVPQYVPGVGNVQTSAGFAVGSIPAAGMVVVDLRAIRAFLKGAIAVTSGTGLVAVLAEE